MSVVLIVSLLLGLAPTAVWAEAANKLGNVLAALGSGDTQESWVDGADRTQVPKYYSFTGEQVLEQRPDMGPEHSGVGGDNLKVKVEDSMPIFPVAEGKFTLTWEDTLQAWIDEQEGEPVSPPTGYKVTLTLKDRDKPQKYTLVQDKMDKSGTNTFVWNGKDDDGNTLPDGFYDLTLSAAPVEVSFKLPPDESVQPPVDIIKSLTAPSYDPETQRVILDRNAPNIVGVHPLGGGKLAVEARDYVGGLKKLTVEGAASVTKSWTDNPPLRAAISLQPGDAATIFITVEDIAGNKAVEMLPLYPYVTGTGNADSVPSAEAVIAGQNVRINLATGNGTQKFNGFVQERPGVDLGLFLNYNHQNRIKGQLGYGWNFSLDSRLNKWQDGNITWQGFDGTLYWFKPAGNDSYVTFANGQEQAYPKLIFSPNSSSADPNAFIMEWPNQLFYRFFNDGRLWLIQDRYTTEMSFRWKKVDTYHGSDLRIDKVVDFEQNEVVTFNYEAKTGNLNSTVIADVDALGNELSSGKRRFYFMYNQSGEFVGYREPSQKMTRFTYDGLHRIEQVIDNGNNLREESGETSDSVTTVWLYDLQNRVTRMTMERKQDKAEEFLGAQYESNQATVRQPLGSYTLRWDDALHPTEQVEMVQTPEGELEAKTTYVYSGNNLIRVTDPIERVTRYRYNEFDNVIAEQSPSGRIVHYAYDSNQDLTGETGPLGHDIKIDYTKNFRKILTQTTTQQAVDPAGINDAAPIVTVKEFNLKGDISKRMDGGGNLFDYTYDVNGFLTSDGTRVTYENDQNGNAKKITTDAGTPDEAVTTQTFNAVGWLLHRESPNGLIEDFEHDNWGRLKKQEQRDQNDASKTLTYTYDYDDGGNLVEESDGLTKTTYAVDGMGNKLSRTTVPLEAGTTGTIEETYVYDSRGLLKSQTDARGETVETVYNVAGQQVQSNVLPNNRITITKVEYDEAGRRKAVIAPDDGRTEYVYDAWDRVLTETRTILPLVPDNLPVNVGSIAEKIEVTETRYDSAGRVVEEKRPGGAWTRYAYDGNGNVASESHGGLVPTWNGAPLASGTPDTLYPDNEVLGSQSYTYDKFGRLLTETDGKGYTTAYRYEGRTVETLTPAFQESGEPTVVTRKVSYDTRGHVIHSVSEAEEEATGAFDAFGHATQSVNVEGQLMQYLIDPYGRMSKRIETVDVSGATQTVRYVVDAWGHVREEHLELKDGAWASTFYSYSPAGELLEERDAAGLVTVFEHDKHDRLMNLKETDTLTREVRLTSYDYDIMGRQTAVVQPDGSHELSVYDTAGRGIVSIDGLNHATTYRYDAAGSLVEQAQYKKDIVALTPDNVSALTRYVVNSAGNTVIMQDPNGNVTRSIFDPEGRLLTETNYEHPDMTGEQIVNTYAYDPRGLLIASEDGNRHTTKYAYDAEGQQVKTVDPEGHWVAYAYSPSGFTKAERRPLGRDTEWEYDYRGNMQQEKDALGNVMKLELDIDGRTSIEHNKLDEATAYMYDNAGRVKSKETPSNGTYTYEYDAVGNKLTETKPIYGTTSYDYDKRDSLTTVKEPQAKTAYTYDADLNRTSQLDGNLQLTTYDYDEQGRRLAKTVVRAEFGQDYYEYTYDPNGNLRSEKKPGQLEIKYEYDYMNRKKREDYSNGTWVAYTYDKANNVKTRSDTTGTILYTYYDNNQLKQATYPNGDTMGYEYNLNGEKSAEIINGKRSDVIHDTLGRPKTYTDTNRNEYTYEYDADGFVTDIIYPNGTITKVSYKPGHLIDTQHTEKAGTTLHASSYVYNAREFVTSGNDQGDATAYTYNVREQLSGYMTPEGDNIQYEYDGAGNRTVRKTLIQGAAEDKNQTITSDELLERVLASFGMKQQPGSAVTPSVPDSGEASPCEPHGNGNANGQDKDKGNNGNGNGNGNGNSNGKDKSASSHEVKVASFQPILIAGKGNDSGGGNSGGGNSGGNDKGNSNGNSKDKDKDNNGKGIDKGKDNNGNSNSGDCGSSQGWKKALENGNGKKLGLYKKLSKKFGNSVGTIDGTSLEIDTLFESGKIEHIIAAIDNIVNGEVNLPPGDKTKLFERIREIGKGYTVIGTKYMYNSRNQLIHRDNQIRYEEYDYTYDEVGNLETDSRSKYEWDARGHLTKVTFPDGFGEKYTYDMQGRRMTKIQFNHSGDEQHTTSYHYKGDTWVLTDEVHSGDDGETTKSYTYDANDRPLSITFKGQTYWYVYNGHGDIMALTDQDGNVAARYEYDAWGLVTRMYNRFGERVREGMGWIGDLGSGNGSPGSLQGPEDSSGNIVPDYHPGIGNAESTVSTETETTVESAPTDGITLDSVLAEEVDKPTEDITTDLVKENPIRYAGYYWDRKTQYYYLQARYYDPRPARFISEDSYEGDVKNPLTLNLYSYVQNNPLKYTDPSGHEVFLIHGTFGKDSTWTPEFVKYVGGLFDEPVVKKGWSGGNTKGARSKAADEIFKEIYEWHMENPDEPIRLVGHSHGGNVAIMVTNLLAKKEVKVETLITIATPVRGYKLKTSVGQHIQLYNESDEIQIKGGSIWLFGGASRKFPKAQNVEVSIPFWQRWHGKDNHSYMHSNIDVWKEYVEPILN